MGGCRVWGGRGGRGLPSSLITIPPKVFVIEYRQVKALVVEEERALCESRILPFARARGTCIAPFRASIIEPK